jgi:RHS repeat-associated protein
VSAQRIYSVAGTAFVERSTDPGASGVVWLATDPQGTVGDQVNSATGARAIIRLDPFGRARGSSSSAWADGRGFLNAPVDAATGLVRLGVRLYDSTLGRFLSVDPVLSPGNPQQNNGYSYAANNPVTYSDASGACYLGGGDTCVHDKPAKKKTGTTTPSSSSQQPSAKKDAPPKKAAKQEEQWWNPFSWSANTWQDVGAVAAGVVAGVVVTAAIVGAVACTAVTFGVCAVAVTAVALAAGGAVAGGVTYALQSGEKSDEGMLQAIGWGSLGGLGGGALGGVVGRAAGAIGSKIATSAAPKVAAAADDLAAGATGAGAGNAADHVVLGLRSAGLEDTANSIGARTLLNDPDWMNAVQNAIGDPMTRISVSLDGFAGNSTYTQVMGAAQRGATGVGSATDWEMAQLFQSGRLADINFLRGGAPVANPWGGG